MAQIDTIEPGDGWVIFKVRDPEDASAKATVKLYDKVHGYLLTHRGYRVRTTLTFVADGNKIAVQLWLDPPETTAKE